MCKNATLPRVGSVLLGLLLMTPWTLEAQRFKWWQDESVKQEIGLSARQTRKIDGIFNASMPELIKAKRELDRLERELMPFVDSATDDAGLVARVEAVEMARAELNKHRSVMLLRMRLALTVEQRVKLEALQKARSRRGSHDKPDRAH
jgi:Spy/CpxP family protein refolding chaperone